MADLPFNHEEAESNFRFVTEHPEWRGPVEALQEAASRGHLRLFKLRKSPSVFLRTVYNFVWMQSYAGDYGIVLVRWDPSRDIKRHILEDGGLSGTLDPHQWISESGGSVREYPERMAFLRHLQDTFERTGLGFSQTDLTVGTNQLYILFKGPKGELSVQWNWGRAKDRFHNR